MQMAERGRIGLGIDYDGVIVEKPKSWDMFRRPTKMGLPTHPDAIENISLLAAQPDVDLLGVYTVRPEWLRREQTERQIRRRGIPVEKVTHTTNSSENKIEALLLDAVGIDRNAPQVEDLVVPDNINQIVLIDDSVAKVVSGAIALYDHKQHLRPLLGKFTLAAFNSEQPEQVRDLTVPGKIHVVTMRNWSETGKMLNEVRELPGEK
jgi:hypothetical protein